MTVKDWKISWPHEARFIRFLSEHCVVKQPQYVFCDNVIVYTHIVSLYFKTSRNELQDWYLESILYKVFWREGVITLENDLSWFNRFPRWLDLSWCNPLISTDLMHVRSARRKRIHESYMRYSDRLTDYIQCFKLNCFLCHNRIDASIRV